MFDQVLKDKNGVEFAPAGSFTMEDGVPVIMLATSAPYSTAYHEAFHALFERMAANPAMAELRKVLAQAANNPAMVAKLRKLLANEPEALAQIGSNYTGHVEERMAYMAEFYLSGQLDLKTQPAGIVERVAAAARKLFKLMSDDDRAKSVLDAFRDGKLADDAQVGAVARTLMTKGAGPKWLQAVGKATDAMRSAGQRLSYTRTGRLMATGVPALEQLAGRFQHDPLTGEDSGSAGYLTAVNKTTTMWLNEYAKAAEGLDKFNEPDVLSALQRGDLSTLSPENRAIAEKLRGVLKKVMGENTRRNTGLKDRGEDYFPRVWDNTKIGEDLTGFAKLLQKHGLEAAEANRVAGQLAQEGGEFTREVPYWGSEFMRKLPDTDAFRKDAQAYLEDSLERTMIGYLRGAAKRLEYVTHFGRHGETVDRLLQQAGRQGATKEELEDARQMVLQMQGTYDYGASRTADKLSQWAMTVANVAYMPLGLFASLQDPVGLAVRSGNMKLAVEGYKNAAKDAFGASKSERMKLAEEFGVNADEAVADMQHTMYDGHGFDGTPKRINDFVFKWNMMDGLTRSLRATATEHAFGFIEQHVNQPGKHSERFLNSLGLTPERRAKLQWKDGKLVRDAANGALTTAVHRYVDSVVQRPTAAERPAWADDPRFKVLFQYKQFAYTFERQITSRLADEALEHKNYRPLLAAAAFLPAALAGMWMKSLLTGGTALSTVTGPFDVLAVAAERVFGGPTALWGGVVEDPFFGAGPVVNTVASSLES